jgi:Mor family transcriptional regulator
VNYKNGRDVLPPRLLSELQQYIQGELIYIPKPAAARRAGWGELSGARRQLAERNEQINFHYSSGWSIEELEQEFHLSGESIRKIIVKTR